MGVGCLLKIVEGHRVMWNVYNYNIQYQFYRYGDLCVYLL